VSREPDRHQTCEKPQHTPFQSLPEPNNVVLREVPQDVHERTYGVQVRTVRMAGRVFECCYQHVQNFACTLHARIVHETCQHDRILYASRPKHSNYSMQRTGICRIIIKRLGKSTMQFLSDVPSVPSSSPKFLVLGIFTPVHMVRNLHVKDLALQGEPTSELDKCFTML